MKSIEIFPIQDSGMKEYIVRDDSAMSVRKIPEAVWKYLTSFEMDEEALIGSLVSVKRPLLDPYKPQFGVRTKEPVEASYITYKRVTDSEGNVIRNEIVSEKGTLYEGGDAPLVAEGMRILSAYIGAYPLSLSFTEEIEKVEENNAPLSTAFLRVNIEGEVLIYEEGYLLFSGEKAMKNFAEYSNSLTHKGTRYTMKDLTYTKDTAPAKYLRDL